MWPLGICSCPVQAAARGAADVVARPAGWVVRTACGTAEGAATRAAEGAATRAAEMLAAIPDRHLERLMRSPARRPVVETVFVAMPLFLNRTRARGLNLAIRWHVTRAAGDDNPDTFDLILTESRVRVLRGSGAQPPLVTITVDSVELLRLATGRSHPLQSYFGGRLKLRGDIMQAARLTSLFTVPRPPQGPPAES